MTGEDYDEEEYEGKDKSPSGACDRVTGHLCLWRLDSCSGVSLT
jgi:hypothetical protein